MPADFLTPMEYLQVVIIFGGLICIIVYGAFQHKQKQVVKQVLKETDEIFAGYGFKSLKREEFNNHKKTLAVENLFIGNFSEEIDFSRCYKKSSGDVDFFLSDVQEYWHNRVQRNRLISGDRYWNFYCAVPTQMTSELAIHHKERCIPKEIFGSRLEIIDPVDNFEKIFIVKSTDKELKQTSIPPEIQKILLSYKDQYPIVSSGMQEKRTYIFLGKDEISVSAPFNESNSAVVSLFELGAELAEYFKNC